MKTPKVHGGLPTPWKPGRIGPHGREIVAETTERVEEIVTAVVAEKMRERAEEADAATDETSGIIEQVQSEAGGG